LPAILVTGIFSGGEPADKWDNRPVSYPAEFERQQAVWMQWPPDEYDRGDHPVYPVMINVIKALDSYVKINLLCESEEEATEIKNLLRQKGCSAVNISFHVLHHLSIWARDVGPTFVKDDRGNLQVVNFGFNDYGKNNDRYYIDVEGRIDKLIGQRLGLSVIESDLVSEGGGVESNGSGTIMTTESVALSRNPGLTKDQIESEYKRVLGVKKVIWLKQGLAEDDRITGGHVDEIARFADSHTILLATVLPSDRPVNQTSQESHRRLEEDYRILLGATDQDGKPFRIIRIPMPPALYREADDAGHIPVRSYLNYAVTNGAVLLPVYWKPGRPLALKSTEEDIGRVFRAVFPGRTIIGIDAENVNLWGGGIHCMTRHMPM